MENIQSDKSVYLGDIDPNNEIISVLNIRRMMMFQLLIWDSIVLSDSQLLTDPRINVLMGQFSDEKTIKTYGLDDVAHSQKGFECLINAGLIEVAHRESERGKTDFLELWTKMSQKDTKDVPYLPFSPDYAVYLDGLGGQSRSYKLSSISQRFRSNLIEGIEKESFIINGNDDTDLELKRIFNERQVLFRNILDFLQTQLKNGAITQARYNEIYRYVYSCYSVNISAETGCNISTRFENLPLHLDSGEGDCEESGFAPKVDQLRPTWSLNPFILDYISFEDFVKIRKKLQLVFDNGKLIDFYKGNVNERDWSEVKDLWETFTIILEDELKNHMRDLMYRKYSADNPLKNANKLSQNIFVSNGVELVKNIFSFALEPVGLVFGTIDLIRSLCGEIYCLTKKKSIVSAREQERTIRQFIEGKTRIVTKY